MTPPLATPLILRSSLDGKLKAASTAAINGAVTDKIIEASQQLQNWCHRRFDERIDTRYFTARFAAHGGDIEGRELLLNDDLRAVTTLTNGNGAVLSGSDYVLHPRNTDPRGVNAKGSVYLVQNTGVFWVSAPNDPVDAISLLGLWGYGGQWKNTGITVASGLSGSASTASFAASAALELGMMLKVDSEYIYVSAVAGTTTTIERACNGSTAVTHADGSAVYRWEADPLVQKLVTRLVLVSIQQDSSPLFANLIIGDATAAVASDGNPKDVLYEVQKAGLKRPQRILAV